MCIKQIPKLALVALLAAIVITSSYGNPVPSYGPPGTGENSGAYSSPNYQFGYSVYDPTNGNDFMHEEERNDQAAKGQYRVMLPDGRLQIVTYTADQNGYRAEVTYQDSGVKPNSYAAPNPHPVAPSPSHAPVAPVNRYQGNQPRDPKTYSRVKATVAGQQYQYSY